MHSAHERSGFRFHLSVESVSIRAIRGFRHLGVVFVRWALLLFTRFFQHGIKPLVGVVDPAPPR
jgi:hypothetical protein